MTADAPELPALGETIDAGFVGIDSGALAIVDLSLLPPDVVETLLDALEDRPTATFTDPTGTPLGTAIVTNADGAFPIHLTLDTDGRPAIAHIYL